MIQQEGNMTAQDEEDDEKEHEKARLIHNSTNESAIVPIKFVEGGKNARGEQEEGR